MYHPTTRVLTVLEMLQARGSASGPDLAARLEVDLRTIRRYIVMLQEMGIPIESRPGRYGGYRLRPGFRLPPLMLADDEALAVTLGLLFARRFGLTGAAPATEGALAKIERVLPAALRAQVHALDDALILDWPRPPQPGDIQAPRPPSATLLTLAVAVAAEQRTVLTYQDQFGTSTTRPFDPYGVVYLSNTAWYAVGHCHLRQDVRVFRLDRIASVEPEGTPFTRPADLDCLGYVRRSIALLPSPWSVEITLDAPLAEAQRWLTPLFTELTDHGTTTLMRCTISDLDWLARLLASLPFPFRVHTPPDLRHALARVRDRLTHAIDTP